MTVRLVQASMRGEVADGSGGVPVLTCAFVNNMPDGAFDATERQYLGLLEEGSRSNTIELRRYTVEGVPRGEQTSKRIEEQYLPLSNLYLDPPDILIVTGSNPIEVRMQDELYWADLAELITWGREHVRSTFLSCLAAHAALAVFDGVDRIRLPAKYAGVFPQHVEKGRPLTVGLEPDIVLPHSRWNTVPREALEQSGYDVLIHSEIAGWALATREEEGRQLVLVQGHPEYDPSSLLREYRRDAGRYVRHERDDTPFLPYHCVSSDDWEHLKQTHHEIIQSRDPLVLEHYPFDEVAARTPWPWRSSSERFYENWLTSVVQGED